MPTPSRPLVRTTKKIARPGSRLEALEARIAPAYTAALVGTAVTFTDSAGASDTLTFDVVTGMLHHNRATSLDPGFASDFDMDSTVAGVQSITVATAPYSVTVFAGDGNDTVNLGTLTSPAIQLTANGIFNLHGETDTTGDKLFVENSTDMADQTVGISATAVAFTAGPKFNFDTFETLSVKTGTGSDTINFTAAPTGATTTVDGGLGLGVNTLNGPNATNLWKITGPNAGTLNAPALTFSNIQTLVGGTGDDTFTLGSAVTFIGTIKGGLGTDVLAVTDGVNDWAISDINAGTLNGMTPFESIETLDGGTGDNTFTLAMGVTTFNGTIHGGTGNNALTATDGTNDWQISAVNAGTLNGTTVFDGIQTLTGGTGDDSFTLAAGVTTFSGAIHGGTSGTDVLAATDGMNDWQISAANAGTLNGTTTFDGISTLTGGIGDDTFTLATGVTTFNGTINGGDGAGTDVLAATDGVNDWQISAANTGTLNASTAFNGIETLDGGTGDDTFTLLMGVTTFNGMINGGSGGADVLAATDGTNDWVITDMNTGMLNGSTAFSNIQTLNGGSEDDTFTLAAGVTTFNGTIDGGTGSNVLAATDGTNTWSISDANTGTLNMSTPFSNIGTLNGGTGDDYFILQAGVITFSGTITGGTGDDTLAAIDGGNEWVVSGPDSGTLNTTTIFSAIPNLSGGTGNDTFFLNEGGSISGTIAGGGVVDSDTLTYENRTTPVTVTLTDVGVGSGTDVGAFNGIESVVGSDNSGNVLTGSDLAATWLFNGTGGTYTVGASTMSFAAFQDLEGGTAIDTFNIQTIAASFPLKVGGNGGDDVFNVSSDAPTNQGNVDDILSALTIDGGFGSNTLAVSDYSTTSGNVAVVVTKSKISGLAGADNVDINYSATGGTFGGGITIDGSNTVGDVFNVKSTLAGGTTTINTNAGDDTINVSSDAPMNLGNLDGIAGTLTLDAGAGTDSIVLSDAGGATANSNVIVTDLAVTGFAGAADAVDINYSFAGSGTLRLEGDSKGETFNVQSTAVATTINTNDGDDTVNVSSNAGTNTGDLNGIADTLTLNLGMGTDAIVLSDAGGTTDNSNVVVTNALVTGFAGATDTVDVSYTFDGDGTLQLEGDSNGETFHVQSTLVAIITTINTHGGDDTVNVSSDAPTNTGDLNGIAGVLNLNMGAGDDTIVLSDAGGMTAHSNVVVTDAAVTGFAGSGDNVDVNYTFDETGTLTLEGNANGETFHVKSTLKTTVISVETIIHANDGDDTILVSSDGTGVTGNVDDIKGALTLDGGTGSDLLKISDKSSLTADTVTMNDTTITGLAPGTITYTPATEIFEAIELTLTDVADAVNLAVGDIINVTTSMNAPSLTVHAGAGGDTGTLHVDAATDLLALYGEAGSDNFTIVGAGMLHAFGGSALSEAMNSGDLADTLTVSDYSGTGFFYGGLGSLQSVATPGTGENVDGHLDDTVIAVDNAHDVKQFTLGDNSLKRDDGTAMNKYGLLTLNSVEAAKLEGNGVMSSGVGAVFDVTAWTGHGSLKGGVNKAKIISDQSGNSSLTDVNMVIKDTSFTNYHQVAPVKNAATVIHGRRRISHLPATVSYTQSGINMTLSLIGDLVLTGNEGTNLLDAGEFTGNVDLAGGGNIDILVAGKGNASLYGLARPIVTGTTTNYAPTYGKVNSRGVPIATTTDHDFYYVRDNPNGAALVSIFATTRAENVISFLEASVGINYALPEAPALNSRRVPRTTPAPHTNLTSVTKSGPELKIDVVTGYLQDLEGGSGDDTLKGNVRLNSIFGGLGRDTLIAKGLDALFGGFENPNVVDTFVPNSRFFSLDDDPIQTNVLSQRVFMIAFKSTPKAAALFYLPDSVLRYFTTV